jgi:hypothetical protein
MNLERSDAAILFCVIDREEVYKIVHRGSEAGFQTVPGPLGNIMFLRPCVFLG